MKVAILRDHNPESSRKWEIACVKRGVEFITINLLSTSWFEVLNEFNPDFCLNRPPGDIRSNKILYDERIFFIEQHLNYRVFPGFLATYIYENKSALSWFLRANKIPHPSTRLFTIKDQALAYCRSANFPIVSKTLIGASGSGVKIIKNRKAATAYINKAFSTGIRRRYGPNRNAGNAATWLKKAIASPNYLIKKLTQYSAKYKDNQKDIVLFQEFIPHKSEWRCVKIGKSYFAYKKLVLNNHASGSKQIEFEAPPIELLDFTRTLCNKYGFLFMTVDIFYENGTILVNELQAIFGHQHEHICRVDGKSGRYKYSDDKWTFEEGSYNSNESYDLRLDEAIDYFNTIS